MPTDSLDTFKGDKLFAYIDNKPVYLGRVAEIDFKMEDNMEFKVGDLVPCKEFDINEAVILDRMVRQSNYRYTLGVINPDPFVLGHDGDDFKGTKWDNKCFWVYGGKGLEHCKPDKFKVGDIVSAEATDASQTIIKAEVLQTHNRQDKDMILLGVIEPDTFNGHSGNCDTNGTDLKNYGKERKCWWITKNKIKHYEPDNSKYDDSWLVILTKPDSVTGQTKTTIKKHNKVVAESNASLSSDDKYDEGEGVLISTLRALLKLYPNLDLDKALIDSKLHNCKRIEYINPKKVKVIKSGKGYPLLDINKFNQKLLVSSFHYDNIMNKAIKAHHTLNLFNDMTYTLIAKASPFDSSGGKKNICCLVDDNHRYAFISEDGIKEVEVDEGIKVGDKISTDEINVGEKGLEKVDE